MRPSPAFARRLFFWAGIYGIAVLAPLYFLEETFGRISPPAISHPEQYYGFIGVALAWQFAFLLIARDVIRFRPIMLPAAAEKLLSSCAALILVASGRTPPFAAGAAAIDLVLGILFLLSYRALDDSRQ